MGIEVLCSKTTDIFVNIVSETFAAGALDFTAVFEGTTGSGVGLVTVRARAGTVELVDDDRVVVAVGFVGFNDVDQFVWLKFKGKGCGGIQCL